MASYSWNFGDNSAAGTGKTTTHTYAAAGTYTVALTVTDNSGATNTVSHSITVSNLPPVAAFTSSSTGLVASFDGSTSSDPDGTVASYSWNFGDNSAAGTGKTTTHTYAAAGTYTVALTVTDNAGAHQHGVASDHGCCGEPASGGGVHVLVAAGLVGSFDGSTSSDPDGTVASYAWNFGDNTTGTGKTASHTYAAAGTYTVTLTVTDNSGATNAISHSITVSNLPPVASFTAAPVNLTVAFDASASSDPDGTIASYSWNFGDNSAAGTGVKPSHTYASAGSYTVTLTVTDNAGASTTKTMTVVVNPVTTLFSDTFTRTTTASLGTADSGGAWTDYGTASSFSTNGSTGQLLMTGPGDGPQAILGSVSQLNMNLVVDSAMTKVATGNGSFMTVILRDTGGGQNDYRFKVRYMTGGGIHIVVSKLVNWGETVLTEVNVSGLTFNVGDTLRARVVISGSGTTTITGKVWKVGTTEPAANQVSVTDTEPTLQSAGAVGLQAYLSGSSTNAPVGMTIDNLSATAS